MRKSLSLDIQPQLSSLTPSSFSSPLLTTHITNLQFLFLHKLNFNSCPSALRPQQTAGHSGRSYAHGSPLHGPGESLLFQGAILVLSRACGSNLVALYKLPACVSHIRSLPSWLTAIKVVTTYSRTPALSTDHVIWEIECWIRGCWLPNIRNDQYS